MSQTEHGELPRRPRKTPIWGKYNATIFVMQDKHGQQFLVEKTGDGLYELTICVYSKKAPLDPDQERTEYVIHTNSAMLKMLVKQIQEATNM